MKRLEIHLFLGVIILISILNFFSAGVVAENINLSQVLKYGLENNSTIRDIYSQIGSIKREIKKNKASQSWQFAISGTFFVEGLKKQDTIKIDDPLSRSEDNINLIIKKRFENGFSFNSELEIVPEDISTEVTINVGQKFLPPVHSELEIDNLRKQIELENLFRELQSEKSNQIISWIETYINLLYLNDSLNLQQERMELAEDKLKEIKKRQEIGEAGRQDYLAAKLEVKNMEIELEQIRNEFQETEKSFYNSLNLSPEQKVNLNQTEKIIDNLAKMVAESNLQEMKVQELMEELVHYDKDLILNLENRRILQKEQEWQKKESWPELKLGGKYQSYHEETILAVSLSYDIYDGGSRKLEQKTFSQKIEDNKREYKEIYQQKEEKLENLINELKIGKKEFTQTNLKKQQASLEKEIGEYQKNKGILTESEYRKLIIKKKQAESDYNTGKKQILNQKLKLINFIYPEKIIKLF